VAVMWESAEKLSITPEQESTLQAWVRAQNTPQSVVMRCRIVLMAADGLSNNQISKQLGISRPTVILWRERFVLAGPSGLTEIEKGRGRKPSIAPDQVKRIIDATLHRKPKGSTHWSCRTMAEHCGASPATVQRIWDAHGLQPHRVKKFKLSRDPQFVEKLTDVVGLYMNPPEKALVVCVDEKSQIQALDRTQPGLPMKKGRCGTMTHDFKRHGTTTLFAALNVLEGTVVADCMPRHRNQEFLAFLRKLDRESPANLDLHLIVDNYSAHKHPNVAQWLSKRPRFHMHFIPTSSSWLNLIERWFAKLTDKQIRRGIFHSVPELIRTIRSYVKTNNQNPVPFVWTASVQSIMDKINRCKAIYATQH
jgi:transposase